MHHCIFAILSVCVGLLLRFGRDAGASDEVCCVDAAGFLCVLFLVEVEQHPIDRLVFVRCVYWAWNRTALPDLRVLSMLCSASGS